MTKNPSPTATAATARGATSGEPWSSIRHPAVLPLTSKDRRLANFGLALYVISQAIPYFVLINVRWMLADGYVPSDVNHWFGGLLPTILLAVGIVFAWVGVRANSRGHTRRLESSFVTSVVLGIAGIVTLMVPFWAHSWDVLSHYGAIYVICLGVTVCYSAVTVVVVLGVVFRARAGLVGPQTPFGPYSAAVVWTFNAVAWFALYVTLYLV